MTTRVCALTLPLLVLGVGCSAGGAVPAPMTEPHVPTAVAAPSAPHASSEAEEPSTAELGKRAPDFTLADLDGRRFALSALRGKTVVLEWFNPDCPFVRYNHERGSLKEMAKRQMDRGVIWLSINSGAPGKQGYGKDANAAGRQRYGMVNPILLDESGDVGRRYGAKTTPHMFVVDARGTLVYEGAIDNTPDGDPPLREPATNYVELALTDLAAGRPVATKKTDAYGCRVKYASN